MVDDLCWLDYRKSKFESRLGKNYLNKVTKGHVQQKNRCETHEIKISFSHLIVGSNLLQHQNVAKSCFIVLMRKRRK